jgi:hypothetical protein
MHKEIGGEDGGTVTDNREQLALHMAGFIGTHNHIGLHPWRLRTDGEQLSAMEEIVVVDGWQIFQAGEDVRYDTFHAAKILFFLDIMT